MNVRRAFYLAIFAVAQMLFVGCDSEDEIRLPEGQMTVSLSENAGEAVDLGLSVLWADRYVGADSPEECGDYFAWGETEPKDWGLKEDWKFYGVDYADIPILIHGTEHDAARMNWGGKWRLPTMAEVAELKEKCTLSGDTGCVVTGPNGNTIYFAETGSKFWNNDIIGHKIEDCYMWHSRKDFFWELSYSSSQWWCNYSISSVHPENGMCVRPVMDK